MSTWIPRYVDSGREAASGDAAGEVVCTVVCDVVCIAVCDVVCVALWDVARFVVEAFVDSFVFRLEDADAFTALPDALEVE
ncbi:MAG: hypothetical protein M3154_04380 [Candidatus Eremiobacteraeota bacterium]|nr:hypothetical protein [Candidatus Eremiobacteraeota bacterium]